MAFERLKSWGSHHQCGIGVVCGFALGTVGLKALKSEEAKKRYVKIVASGIRAKNAYLDICEQAKAEVDDIIAEATYISSEETTPCEA